MRLYNHPGEVIYAPLRTPRGRVTVAIPVDTAIDILTDCGSDSICPCRFYVRSGVGYICPASEIPPPVRCVTGKGCSRAS